MPDKNIEYLEICVCKQQSKCTQSLLLIIAEKYENQFIEQKKLLLSYQKYPATLISFVLDYSLDFSPL